MSLLLSIPNEWKTHFVCDESLLTGSNEWMLVITFYPLISPSAIFALLCLLNVCTVSGVLRITAAGAPVSETLVVSVTLRAWPWKVHLPRELSSFCVWLARFPEWVACSVFLWSTCDEGNNGLKLFFADPKLCVLGLGLNLLRHNFPHLWDGNNNSNDIWDYNVA